MANDFITLLKITSLASVISLRELMTNTQTAVSSSFRFAEWYGAAAVCYLVLVSIFMVGQAWLERRYVWTSQARGASGARSCGRSADDRAHPGRRRASSELAATAGLRVRHRGPRRLEALRLQRGAAGRVAGRPSRRREGHPRPVGLGQEHAAALPRPAGADRPRRGPPRGDARRRPRVAAAAASRCRSALLARQRTEIGMVFQRFNLFPHLHRARQRDDRPDRGARRARAEARAAADAMLERVGLGERADLLPVRAVRRPAAARRDRPRAGDAAQGDALRRADIGPRPGAGRRGARRDGGAGPRGHDDDRGDPRDRLRPGRRRAGS